MNKSIIVLSQNEAMRAILSHIDKIVPSDSSILLIGETGVGKELVAEYIHRTSPRQLQPFVKVGLSALPAELLESELFGHEKGAFTSASTEKKGLFELADTGSIFLDDIDDFPLHLQSKLLRVLESRELMRIGGHTSIPIDVRLITASKIDLKELVERGLFRADLYYRINVVPITIPPLRDRRDDIPLLTQHYLRKFIPEKPVSVSTDAMRALVNYHWPGNIRELRNAVQRISLFINHEVGLQDLPKEIREDNPVDFLLKACNKCFIDGQMTFEQITACLEINLIRQAMKQAEGNRSLAAKTLGMNLSTFRDKLKKYEIE
jgi:transcriptional regulator with GAF, ATPase, and Fis domain